MTNLNWRVAAITDRGLIRSENQDNYFISSNERAFVVADGMGGTKNGALASKLAVQAVKTLTEERWPSDNEESYSDWLVKAVSEANAKVFNESEATNATISRMGTTLLIAIHISDVMLRIANVGDSRAYLIRGNEIHQLTDDDSVVGEMYSRGQITKDQAWNSVYRHLLTRCVGHDNELAVETIPVQIEAGDWIVLCTDGLCSVVRDEQILAIMQECTEPDEACQRLLDKTIALGAPDNVTMVVIKYSD